MKKEVKEKIEMIRQGEVPKGYRKIKNVGIVPEKWDIKKIKDVAPLQRGFDLPSYLIDSTGNNPVCYSNGILKNHKEYKVKGPGVFTGRSGTIGEVFYVEENYWPHNTSLWVNDFKNNYPKFIFYLYKQINLKKFNAGTSVPTLNRNDVHTYLTSMPGFSEQQNIASILSTWDRAIKLKEQLIEEKKKLKKGLMQNLLTGQIRLPGFVGEWKNFKLEDVLFFKRKEPLDNPEKYKLLTIKLHVKGIEATDKKPNVTKKGRPYFLQEEGELLIGRQNFHNGGIGIVPEGMANYVASNAISSLEAKKGSLNFYYYYLSNSNFYKKAGFLIGGTGQKEASESMIKKLIIRIPDEIEEQLAIVQVLKTVEKEIQLIEQELDLFIQQKKVLMQLLLTGIVRVPEAETANERGEKSDQRPTIKRSEYQSEAGH